MARAGGENFLAVTDSTNNWDQGSGRFDYTISSKDTVFARYTQQEQTTVVGGITVYNSQTFPTNPKSIATGWTHIFSPTLVNNLRFGFTHTETGETRAFGFDAAYANPVGLKMSACSQAPTACHDSPSLVTRILAEQTGPK